MTDSYERRRAMHQSLVAQLEDAKTSGIPALVDHLRDAVANAPALPELPHSSAIQFSGGVEDRAKRIVALLPDDAAEDVKAQITEDFIATGKIAYRRDPGDVIVRVDPATVDWKPAQEPVKA